MTTRYEIELNYCSLDVDIDECESGEWVLYADHSTELATLRAENAALRDVIDDLPDYIEVFRAFKDMGCKSRGDYARAVVDMIGYAREGKEALK